MFAVFDALILSPAPFRDPDTLSGLAVGRDDTGFNVNLRAAVGAGVALESRLQGPLRYPSRDRAVWAR